MPSNNEGIQMIFCIGHSESYREYLKDSKNPCLKLGRKGPNDAENPNYPGGPVWRTKEDAQSHCSPTYEVFGVDADWEKDTVQSDQGAWNDLLIDARFFLLN